MNAETIHGVKRIINYDKKTIQKIHNSDFLKLTKQKKITNHNVFFSNINGMFLNALGDFFFFKTGEKKKEKKAEQETNEKKN